MTKNYTLQAEAPTFDFEGYPHYFTVPADALTQAMIKPWDMTFQKNGKIVLTITSEGELKIAEGACAKDAAEALYDAWRGILGR